MSSLVSYERKGDVVVLTMNDQKMNSFSFQLIQELNKALDRATLEKGSWSLLLLGNAKAFSAGFDLSVMGAPPSMDQHRLFVEGSELVLRFFEFPRPVVFGCSGHALALGAIMLLAGDVRIGKRGKAKIGMNEVAIGMSVPQLAVELARHKLTAKELNAATTQAKIYNVDQAVACGYLDVAVDEADFETTCFAEAERLAKLKNPGFSTTKSFLKREIAEKTRGALMNDATRLLPPEAKL
mmetsp:Transcript_5966/g.6852  ORF Transcript_5966/g.6852 Transcript_5966/m.6852 type:complete len:239 (-) Transcript_5966:4-720(-)